LFAYKIDEGLAIAEQPSDGKSFGMSRSALLADAIIACVTSDTDWPGWMESFEDTFKMSGISIDTPFLNKNSTFNFY